MSRPIFRRQAVERYNARLERIVLPRYATAPWVLIGWLLSGLLLAAVLLFWAAPTPVYVTGPAVVVATPATGGTPTTVAVAIFVPAAQASSLAPAQRVVLQLGDLTEAQGSTALYRVTAVTATPLSPQAARADYGLDASAGSLIAEPVIVALVALDVPSTWLGAVGAAQIEVGAQSALTLLPGLAAWGP